VEYLYFALAGILVGGGIATRQQKRPIWATVVVLLLAVLFLVAGLRETTR
jgi:hypothetical protein